MSLASPTSSAGLSSTLPSTLTRPSAIQRSASRLEQRPARANRLAMRSPFSGFSAAAALISEPARLDEGGKEALVPVADGIFRMPLHADEEAPALVLDALDDAVGRHSVDDEAGR